MEYTKFKITKDWINTHKTPKGSWTKAQLIHLGLKWPPGKGWASKLSGTEITIASKIGFEEDKTKKYAYRGKHLSIDLSSAVNTVINGYRKLSEEEINRLAKMLNFKLNCRGKS